MSPTSRDIGGPLPDEPGPLTVRQPTESERSGQRAAVDAAYGYPYRPPSEQEQQRDEAMRPWRNRRVVVERLPDGGERIIGGAARLDTSLSLPGGASLPVGALSGVGVEPGAQHRGAFRRLVAEHLDDCRARGDAASVLIASVASLYPPYGYGCATQSAHWEIDAAAAVLRRGAPTAGSVVIEHARGDALRAVLRDVWERAGRSRAGTLRRSDAWWDLVMAVQKSWIGGGNLMVALHFGRSGTCDGYVLYTVDSEHGRQGLMEADITIRELVAIDASVELDLWRYIAALPWARRLRWTYGPVDPAPGFWLPDPRQLRRMTQVDFLWLRPLDMSRLVASRSFAVDGRVALEVTDDQYPDLAGRFDLHVANGTGAWRTGTAPAELTLSVADLGALWLGGGSARELLAVRRIAGRAAAAYRLDAMLATDSPPRAVARF